MLTFFSRWRTRRGNLAKQQARRQGERAFRPEVQQLEDRMVPSIYATGSGFGSVPIVNVYSASGVLIKSFSPYISQMTGGVHVAIGDVTGDGIPDIVVGTGADPHSAPHIKVYDGGHLDQASLHGDVVRDFYAYNPAYTGGVWVAVGDIQHVGYDDIVTGPGQGMQPDVKIWNGQTTGLVADFFALAQNFTGGVRLATGDVFRRGFDDAIITAAGPGGRPRVNVWDGFTGNLASTFLAYNTLFSGGVFVASADVNRDGYADIITGPGGGMAPVVNVISGFNGTLIDSFNAFNSNFTGGVRVASVDLNGDGFAEVIVGAGPKADPRVIVYNGFDGTVLQNFDAYAAAFTGGVYVGAGF